MSRLFIAHCTAALFILFTSSACDLLVGPDQITLLGNGGTILGSGGDGFTASLPAVRVEDGGWLGVDDATLRGGGNVVDAPSAPNLLPGQGIRARRGTVDVNGGTIQGGPLLTSVPGLVGSAAAGLSALESDVVVAGGSIVGGSAFSSALPLSSRPGGTLPTLLPGAGLIALDSKVTVTGGRFRPGLPAEPIAFAFNSLFAQRSRIRIFGGDFGDFPVFLVDSNAWLMAGRYGALTFISTGAASVCGELGGGGPVKLISVSGPAPFLIIGTGFNFPLGTGTITGSRLTGVLEDGTPLDAQIAPQSNTHAIRLLAPGTGNCS